MLSTWPTITDGPSWPGAGEYRYHAAVLGLPKRGGTAIVPFGLRPTTPTGASTPMAGISIATGRDLASTGPASGWRRLPRAAARLSKLALGTVGATCRRSCRALVHGHVGGNSRRAGATGPRGLQRPCLGYAWLGCVALQAHEGAQRRHSPYQQTGTQHQRCCCSTLWAAAGALAEVMGWASGCAQAHAGLARHVRRVRLGHVGSELAGSSCPATPCPEQGQGTTCRDRCPADVDEPQVPEASRRAGAGGWGTLRRHGCSRGRACFADRVRVGCQQRDVDLAGGHCLELRDERVDSIFDVRWGACSFRLELCCETTDLAGEPRASGLGELLLDVGQGRLDLAARVGRLCACWHRADRQRAGGQCEHAHGEASYEGPQVGSHVASLMDSPMGTEPRAQGYSR